MMSHGGRPPSGEARSFDQAKKLFQQAFDKWKDGLPPGQFEENLILQAPDHAMNWSRRFEDPIPMPDGSTIRTIGQAAEYATGLPKKVTNTEPWQRAARVLQEAAEHGGPFVFMARIIFCRLCSAGSRRRS